MFTIGYIIFIHGMGHSPNRLYWQSWGANLQPYLIAQGIDPTTIKFAGIYYYDLVPNPGDGWRKVSALLGIDLLGELKQELWEHIVRGVDLKELLGRGPVEGLINLVADNFGDIFNYLQKDEVYHGVNRRVYQALAEATEPVTLVAYSLGSMISYCALQQRPDFAPQMQHFITVGSPIFWFRQWLAKRVNLSQRPTTVPWTNLAAKLDVACPHLVGYAGCPPDQQIECEIEKINPVKGHLSYFTDARTLQALARVIAQKW